ncbi:hypothetical protein L6164_023823 [Bauhinia variegata]|uniref:Uncharacterized protein n=1 Tax=Bauhinia variegata TaxID=167791 RepID=A0ACB9MK95_BAUVA|nr:hypothetical protein L6164_023823 [Bauhinia variegata]
MRTTLLAFFFLAFAFALSTALAAIDVEPVNGVPVLDTDGNPVFNGGLYVILPATPENGGGFNMFALDGETCPISVAQSPSNNSLGMSLFIRVDAPEPVRYVYTNNSVNIIFAAIPVCANSSKWIVKIFTPVPAVFIGEEDERTVAGHFQIRNYEDAYKLVFCPDFVPGTCWDLGISPFGNRRLVTNEQNPFKLVIRSLNPKTSASII